VLKLERSVCLYGQSRRTCASHRRGLLPYSNSDRTLVVLREAVLAGCGIADLPPSIFRNEIADGRLIRLVPKWQLPELSNYAMYPSRQGLPLAVRMLVDHLMASHRRSQWANNLPINDEKRRRSG
jgi:DNA-binding transcriptional LysR family regulator